MCENLGNAQMMNRSEESSERHGGELKCVASAIGDQSELIDSHPRFATTNLNHQYVQ